MYIYSVHVQYTMKATRELYTYAGKNQLVDYYSVNWSTVYIQSSSVIPTTIQSTHNLDSHEDNDTEQ